MLKLMLRYLDFIFVLRPMLFFPGWATMLAGYFIGARQQIYFTPQQMAAVDHGFILKMLLAFALSMGASFLLNQLRDVESDQQNNKLFLVAEGHLKKTALIWETVLLGLIALPISASIGLAFLLLQIVFLILTGYMYNYPPFTFKDGPLGSLLANALMGALAFAAGWLAEQAFSWQLCIDLLPYLFLNIALYFYTTLPDMEGDRSAEKHTLAVVLGLRKVILIAFCSYLLALLFAMFIADFTALLILLPVLPLFVLTIRNYSVESTVRTTKYTILVFTLAICLKWPYFFVLMVTGFFTTKWYFKQRFQFDYPNFKG